MTKDISLLFFTLLILGTVTVTGQVLPEERSVDWSLAGYNGTGNEPSNIIDFMSAGGIGDGITANDSVFSNIMSSISGDSAIIYFPAGIFYFTAPLVLANNTILRGASSDLTELRFELATEDHLIQMVGNVVADTAYLTTDALKDEVAISVDNSSLFQVGDYIRILEVDTDLVTSSWAYYSTGQINLVSAMSGNTLTLAEPLRRNFLVSRMAGILKFVPVTEAGVEDLKIVRLDSTTAKTSNIYFEYAANCRVRCVESYKCNFAHVDVRFSTNIEITGSYIHAAFSYGNGGKGYGIMLQYASGSCLAMENIFDSLRHSMILQAGANGNVFAYNYSDNTYWTGVSPLPANSAGDMVLHGNYPYANLFEGNSGQNIVIDNSHGINGMYNTFFRNRADLYGLVMNVNPASDSQNFIGNEITNSDFLMGNYILQGTNHFEYGTNHLGTIVPGGTDTLSKASLFLDSIPEYYVSNSSWPPIGIPNILDSYDIEAKARYFSGEFTKCPPEPVVAGISAHSSAMFFSTYPNPATEQTVIEFNMPTRQNVSISIHDLSGRKVAGLFDGEVDPGKLYRVSLITAGLSPGIYLCKLRGAREVRTSKLMIVE